MSAIVQYFEYSLALPFFGIRLPWCSDGKVSAYNMGNLGSIPGSGRSLGKGNGNPLLYSCLEYPMDGWRSLVGYSPWGGKESATTEQLHFHFLNISLPVFYVSLFTLPVLKLLS